MLYSPLGCCPTTLLSVGLPLLCGPVDVSQCITTDLDPPFRGSAIPNPNPNPNPWRQMPRMADLRNEHRNGWPLPNDVWTVDNVHHSCELHDRALRYAKSSLLSKGRSTITADNVGTRATRHVVIAGRQNNIRMSAVIVGIASTLFTSVYTLYCIGNRNDRFTAPETTDAINV